MFHTIDPTPTPSLLKMLCRCIVDNHTLPVVCSLCLSGQFPYQPGSSSTLLYVKTPLPYLQHFICQWTLLNTCILTQHLGVWSRTEQIPYVQFPLPHVCIIFHMLLLYFHMLFPKSSTCLLPFITFHVSVLLYISIEYLSCISSVSNIVKL